jgi:hypothetical protein
MVARRDIGRDRREVKVHRPDVAAGQDQADRLALRGADGVSGFGGENVVIRGPPPKSSG